jgi:hypothetical protein
LRKKLTFLLLFYQLPQALSSKNPLNPSLVMQLSLLPADALEANAPLVKEQVNRLYVAQTRLTGAAQLDQSSFDSKHTPLVLTGMNVNDVLDSLHRVRSQTKAVPLAHLLWAHYAACYENDALQPSIPSALDELAEDWTRTGTPLPPTVADWSNRLRDALTKKAPICVF